jgi:hypothetical protein
MIAKIFSKTLGLLSVVILFSLLTQTCMHGHNDKYAKGHLILNKIVRNFIKNTDDEDNEFNYKSSASETYEEGIAILNK